jgi:hypothetical protein
MTIFEIAAKIPGWIQQYGPTAEDIITGLEAAAEMLTKEGKTAAFAIPSLSKIRDGLHYHREKNYLADLMSRDGKLTYSQALDMITAGETPTAAATLEAGGTIGQFFTNVLNWFNANSGTISADIAKLGPLIIQVMTMLSAFGL